MPRDVKPIYRAVNAATARSAFEDVTDRWGSKYPATVPLDLTSPDLAQPTVRLVCRLRSQTTDLQSSVKSGVGPFTPSGCPQSVRIVSAVCSDAAVGLTTWRMACICHMLCM